MALPKSILYPVDFSDRCHAVWPAVAEMARQLRVPVTVFHALDVALLDLAEASTELAAIRRHVREKLQHFLTQELEVPSVRHELAEGSAATCIVHRAAGMDAPLIMMPTRGHTRFRQLLLGSVTASVLHDAACPVWTEAHAEYRSVPDTCRSIVCAIDMGPQTPGVLEAAGEFSKQFGASLHVVHSILGIDPHFASAVADRAHQFLIDEAREKFQAYRQQVQDVPLEIVEELKLVDGIIGAVAKHNADLLLIGRGVIQGSLGRLRTNAHELIRRSPCAVLSV